MKAFVLFLLSVDFLLIYPIHVKAEELFSSNSPYQIAQYQNDDSFDPFADYSEFEESEEEEADVNFFKNGRFFTIGLLVGQTQFTETLGSITQPALGFGAYLSYFFDLRFAMQFSFLTSNNNWSFTTPNSVAVSADSSVSTFGFAIKYYMNTQNVTRGLADLNPYFITGFSAVSRTVGNNGSIDIAQESAQGFEVGAGIEVPVLKNKMYLGLQATFNLITFKNETQELIVGTENTGIYPKGDLLNILGVAGVNF